MADVVKRPHEIGRRGDKWNSQGITSSRKGAERDGKSGSNSSN